jgi:hypothetical protein
MSVLIARIASSHAWRKADSYFLSYFSDSAYGGMCSEKR